MNVVEFVKALDEKYRDGTEADARDIKKWADGLNCSDFQELYDMLTRYKYNFKSFPPLQIIVQTYEEVYPAERKVAYQTMMDKLNKTRDEWKSLELKAVLERVMAIRKKVFIDNVDFNDLNYWDNDFYSIYQDVYTEFRVLKDAGITGEQMKDHLTYVRQRVENWAHYIYAWDKFNLRKGEKSASNERVGKTISMTADEFLNDF